MSVLHERRVGLGGLRSETPLWRQEVSVLHERRAGLGELRNENARGPLRYGPSGNERTGCSDRWCSERGCTWGVK